MESLKAYDSDSSDKDDDVFIYQNQMAVQRNPVESGVKRTKLVTDHSVAKFTSEGCEPRSSTTYCSEGFHVVYQNLIHSDSHSDSDRCTRFRKCESPVQQDKSNWRTLLEPGTFQSRRERTVTSGVCAGSRSIRTEPVCAKRASQSSNSAAIKVRGYVSKRKRDQIEQNQSKLLCNKHKETEGTRSLVSLAMTVDSNEMVLNRVTAEEERKKEITVSRPPKKLHVQLERHTKGVNCIRWNPVVPNLLLSASMDQSVCVWDALAKKDCVLQLTSHDGAVKDARWSSCGSYLLSCGYDKMVRISDINTGKQTISISRLFNPLPNTHYKFVSLHFLLLNRENFIFRLGMNNQLSYS